MKTQIKRQLEMKYVDLKKTKMTLASPNQTFPGIINNEDVQLCLTHSWSMRDREKAGQNERVKRKWKVVQERSLGMSRQYGGKGKNGRR